MVFATPYAFSPAINLGIVVRKPIIPDLFASTRATAKPCVAKVEGRFYNYIIKEF